MIYEFGTCAILHCHLPVGFYSECAANDNDFYTDIEYMAQLDHESFIRLLNNKHINFIIDMLDE